ncbi:SUMF1/EgtB/PvdO family nonheme iron enzyme [Thiohalomonas denitrificans]|uniref:SUMF1/EgtB/PvdO family nonheme iron enzyme n=1 Tax=Thiohalomonas denitrificans TaxID=415747 RepID=UPI0026F15DFE|nr:SUMF1/EgtB/PvdO family nonheme iron enzyme [Thiohalomonas denitrificans]
MKTHEILGQLSQMHQMMAHLLESVPDADAYRSFTAEIPPLAWLFGRGVYVETYWLREVLEGDEDMTARVRPLFAAGVQPDEALIQQLPPREHLLNWALELQDENLMRLANPQRLLPADSTLEDNRLPLLILQEYGRLYERTLAQLTARRLQESFPYQVSTPLEPCPPSEQHVDVHKGMFRVGAKDDPAARDNELPTQVVQLDAFRIDSLPVTSGAFLSFMEAGGYDEPAYWSEEGNRWRASHSHHPVHWRRDAAGAWYGVGLNGPFDLVAEEPVMGVSRHEAEAYARWVASQGERLAGAVLQHEYQWEVAVRSQAITDRGRVWEWCANPFEPYTGYTAPKYPEAATAFEADHYPLRGGCLHSQLILRHTSYRHHAAPDDRYRFSGLRLVFPGSDMPWH